MAIPRTVQAGEHVGLLDAASMRRKRAKNVLREKDAGGARHRREYVNQTLFGTQMFRAFWRKLFFVG